LSILAVLCMVFGSLQGSGFLLDGIVSHIPIEAVTTNAPKVQATTDFQKPTFCHDLDCPKFEVLEKTDKFEKRRYSPSVWVATEIYTMTYSRPQQQGMFFKLFDYIAGNNSMGMKINMTAPVVTEIIHGAGPDCESNFTMHFMVPFDLQANPPQPTEAGVFIKRVPEMTVYVRSYGGYDNDDTKRDNLVMLSNDLTTANKQFRDDVFLTAGYDGPYAFIRHNEIWIAAM